VSSTASDRLDPYRILNVIKAGATSQVCAAIHVETRKRFAIKMLIGAACRDREQIAYLRHEHEVGVKLRHPRVIEVYEYATFRRIPYLAMEYFPAPNMKDIINEVRETLAFMLPDVVIRAAEGLTYLHDQGWIHRDIKPDNFLVSQQGVVKLIDFALAQRKDGFLARILPNRRKIQGTRSYMSPEQIRGEPLDARSDIYSFGCTIFHLLAGQPPFTGANSNDLLSKHLRAAAPSIEAQNHNITTEYADLLRRTMAKKPSDRPESMAAVVQQLRALRAYRTAPPRPPGFGDSENTA